MMVNSQEETITCNNDLQQENAELKLEIDHLKSDNEYLKILNKELQMKVNISKDKHD